MKHHIQQLAGMARKPERLIIGLMSGTSLDGLDVALCAVKGTGLGTKVQVRQFETVPYQEPFKQAIRTVFAKKEIDFQQLVLLNVEVAEQHAFMVLDCLQKWGVSPDSVDLIASHGQTVFHAPRIFHGFPDRPNATLQIGDGDHLSRRTGIITVSDFRQKQLAAGGEGAPLALYGDCFLFSKKGEARFLLNLGGIANFTWLPSDGNLSKALATDTGPGNTLLDAFARELFGVSFDRDALLAAAGQADMLLLEALKSDSFFRRPFPKTSGPEHFSVQWVKKALSKRPKGTINPYDLMATLTQLTAETVAEAIRSIPDESRKKRLFLSGGGAHNPLLIQQLKKNLPGFSIANMSALHIDGDAKEAVLFAVLANETVAGIPFGTALLNGLPVVSMGKISLPG